MDLTSDCAEVSINVSLSDRLHGKCKFLTEKGKNVLEEEEFRSSDFWIGYKFYCYAQYSRCRRYRQRFMFSKMGRVVTAMHSQEHVPWGSFFDEGIRQVWAEMEEYGQVFHGQDWKNLRALMEEFDDVKKLSASVKGSLLMKVVEDDDHGTEREHKRSLDVEIHRTDIFDEVRGRLNTLRSKLGSLGESTEQSSKFSSQKKRKRKTTVLTHGKDADSMYGNQHNRSSRRQNTVDIK